MMKFFFILFLIGMTVGYGRYLQENNVSQTQIESVLTECSHRQSSGQYTQCIRLGLGPLIRTQTVSPILAFVENATSHASNAQTIAGQSACHGIGHIIGEEVVRRTNAPTPELIHLCGTTCGYGCIHGVMYQVAKAHPDIITELRTICRSTAAYTMSITDTDNCTHGLGHFLTEYASYDIQKSVTLCNTGLDDYREQCMSGAIMEMFSRDDKPNDIPGDIVAYCRTYPTFAFEQCVSELTAMQTQTSIHDGFTKCLNFPASLAGTCAISKGTKVYFEENGNTDKIIADCLAESPFINECIEGSIRSSLNMQPSGKNALEICAKSPKSAGALCQKYQYIIDNNNRIHQY